MLKFYPKTKCKSGQEENSKTCLIQKNKFAILNLLNENTLLTAYIERNKKKSSLILRLYECYKQRIASLIIREKKRQVFCLFS